MDVMKQKNLILHLLLPVIVLMVLTNTGEQTMLLEYFTKPLIMIWMALYFVVNAKDLKHPIVKPLLLAYLFSWLGDIALLFSGTTFFIAGIGFFLFAQLCYIFLFQKTEAPFSKSLIRKKTAWIIPVAIYGIVFGGIILPAVSSTHIKIALALYALTILLMALSAFNRKKRVPALSFSFVLSGALLFVLSDSMIAISRFVTKIPNTGFWVMATYIAAQCLIMYGLLQQVNYVKVEH